MPQHAPQLQQQQQQPRAGRHTAAAAAARRRWQQHVQASGLGGELCRAVRQNADDGGVSCSKGKSQPRQHIASEGAGSAQPALHSLQEGQGRFTLQQQLGRAAAGVAAAAVLALGALGPPPAEAVLANPRAPVPRSADVALRRSIPAFNQDVAELQARLEAVAFKLRIPQRKPWASMGDDVAAAASLAADQRRMLAGVLPSDAAQAEELVGSIQETLDRWAHCCAGRAGRAVRQGCWPWVSMAMGCCCAWGLRPAPPYLPRSWAGPWVLSLACPS